MGWHIRDLMKAREEFVSDVKRGCLSHAEVCRRHGISRKTGYKWLARKQGNGGAGLADRSRRPHVSPRRTAAELEQRVVEIRLEHPGWGGRKIRAVLARTADAGCPVPAASTVTGIKLPMPVPIFEAAFTTRFEKSANFSAIGRSSAEVQI